MRLSDSEKLQLQELFRNKTISELRELAVKFEGNNHLEKLDLVKELIKEKELESNRQTPAPQKKTKREKKRKVKYKKRKIIENIKIEEIIEKISKNKVKMLLENVGVKEEKANILQNMAIALAIIILFLLIGFIICRFSCS